jgi:CO/xanthine dehydrogenase FAD-binding subunit
MNEPHYEAPRSLAEAAQLLGQANGSALALAGGTDLLVQMHGGRLRPNLVVDVKKIPELNALAVDADGLLLGAAVCAAVLRDEPRLAELYPGLAEAIALIGSHQIQGRASVGGNLCNASPAADTVPALAAVGAICTIAGRGGALRSVPVEEFVTGPGRTVLQAGELLVAVRIPPPPLRSADAYLRFIPRTEMDIAVAGAAVRVALDAQGRCEAARVALGAVGPTVILCPEAARALIGREGDPAALAAAAAAARAAARPIDDHRAPADYRRKLAGVLTQRAAARAFERARLRS